MDDVAAKDAEETPVEDRIWLEVEESAKRFVSVETAGIDDDTSGVATEELELSILAVLLWIGTDEVVDACIGGATEELKDPAIRELLDSGVNSEEDADDESGGDGNTSIVEELGRPTFNVEEALF
jgi:hypothetical protein